MWSISGSGCEIDPTCKKNWHLGHDSFRCKIKMTKFAVQSTTTTNNTLQFT